MTRRFLLYLIFILTAATFLGLRGCSDEVRVPVCPDGYSCTPDGDEEGETNEDPEGSGTNQSATTKTLRVAVNWQFQGIVGTAGRDGWPIGTWKSGSRTFTWRSDRAAAFNVQGLDHGLRAWAILGQRDAHGGWCASPSVSRSMFVGATPEQRGCRVECSPDGYLNWLCH